MQQGCFPRVARSGRTSPSRCNIGNIKREKRAGFTSKCPPRAAILAYRFSFPLLLLLLLLLPDQRQKDTVTPSDFIINKQQQQPKKILQRDERAEPSRVKPASQPATILTRDTKKEGACFDQQVSDKKKKKDGGGVGR